MRRFFTIAIFLSFSGILWAQTTPRLAVLPLNANGIAKNEAGILTGLLETGLVKTESFTVIEQNQMSDILAAQEVTLSGCTDEACAIEMGKLLAAEQIILGEISRLGSRYIANVKIVDITEGRNIRAEKVDAESLESLMDEMEVLAFLLAGLAAPVAGNGTIVLATEFGELFVETEPSGAEIYVNGALKGTSPAVISELPAGTNQIEIRKDHYYGEKTVTISAGEMSEISVILKVLKSNLFFKAPDPGMVFYFDGVNKGKIGSGLFKDLSVGTHFVELIGEGLAWQGEVELTSGKTLTVDVLPQEYGSLVIVVPQDSLGLLKGKDFERQLRSGVNRFPVLYTGTYHLLLEETGRYKRYEEDIVLERSDDKRLTPEPELTDAYLAELAEAEKQDRIINLRNEIIRLESTAASLQNDIDSIRGGGFNILSGIIWSLLASGAGYGTYYCYEETYSAYEAYRQADTSAKATQYRGETEEWQLYTYIGAGVTAVAGIIGLSNLFATDNSAAKKTDLKRQLTQIEAEIAEKELELEGLFL